MDKQKSKILTELVELGLRIGRFYNCEKSLGHERLTKKEEIIIAIEQGDRIMLFLGKRPSKKMPSLPKGGP